MSIQSVSRTEEMVAMLADVTRGRLDMLGLDVVLDVGALRDKPALKAAPLPPTKARHQLREIL